MENQNSKNQFIEKLKANGNRTSSILIALLVIVLIVFLFINGTFKWPFGQNAQNKQASAEEAAKIALEAQNALQNKALTATNAVPSKITIQIATLANDDGGGVIVGKKVGCDIVRMVPIQIERTPAVLNAAMRAMFGYKQQFDYMPGNFVAFQENLKFDKATIDNGLAKIYLTGTVSYAGACDEPRLEAQVTETAKQFDTVKSVEIYLNGEKYVVPDDNYN